MLGLFLIVGIREILQKLQSLAQFRGFLNAPRRCISWFPHFLSYEGTLAGDSIQYNSWVEKSVFWICIVASWKYMGRYFFIGMSRMDRWENKKTIVGVASKNGLILYGLYLFVNVTHNRYCRELWSEESPIVFHSFLECSIIFFSLLQYSTVFYSIL